MPNISFANKFFPGHTDFYFVQDHSYVFFRIATDKIYDTMGYEIHFYDDVYTYQLQISPKPNQYNSNIMFGNRLGSIGFYAFKRDTSQVWGLDPSSLTVQLSEKEILVAIPKRALMQASRIRIAKVYVHVLNGVFDKGTWQRFDYFPEGMTSHFSKIRLNRSGNGAVVSFNTTGMTDLVSPFLVVKSAKATIYLDTTKEYSGIHVDRHAIQYNISM